MSTADGEWLSCAATALSSANSGAECEIAAPVASITPASAMLIGFFMDSSYVGGDENLRGAADLASAIP
ncbi:hypothetical protein [Brevibacterium luteolum]|uniref:hypothetical protein n=1 Tax=Brevibacterium luteolum TaxID=199591 RepID=UPI00223AC830|nr:hypothetical protein [Brevibacterium luteolum]MCT1873894.1 hypothetical protein [Brevibacterium luteolum]MCT1891201.1 hypothetical protein [Brevibacterium luteolum]MCT1894181.1 hypothetical protein [Brevibacterium luteolum]MCT1924642.1 hypothetical protein [Brevibacterium luteolum]